ncbi:hypothetical protein LOD99_14801 [Oopsacas minuta]|uniref:Uncharacterized protein n=1 Tax=Oopsacas minuta TaxID=111878 RepID=A0AAV7KEI2_9METZ|nr:hypothetical protein LOD99_14801 [Oopsacas minuta]
MNNIYFYQNSNLSGNDSSITRRDLVKLTTKKIKDLFPDKVKEMRKERRREQLRQGTRYFRLKESKIALNRQKQELEEDIRTYLKDIEEFIQLEKQELEIYL